MAFEKISNINNQIVGWELSNPDPAAFTLEVVNDFGKCEDCELAGRCGGLPDQSVRRLIPREGRLAHLGQEEAANGDILTYYALIGGNGDVRFLLLKDPSLHWTSASYITVDEVPSWSLKELRDRENVTPPRPAASKG